jgi:glycine cleavage system transcriptional repressor
MGLMGQELVISAVGEDRPGIVAAVAEALRDHGCNLLDTSMTILRGRFAMMLVVSGPDDTAALDGALEAATAPLGVRCTVAAAPAAAGGADGEPYALSVYGADRPGIVATVARLLADRGVNITDLSTRVIGDRQRPVYAMVLDLVVPASVDVDELTEGLAAVARDLGVHCRLHPVDADVL